MICEMLQFRVSSASGICLDKVDTEGVHPGLHANAIPGPGEKGM
jgi:hypothetical protein